VAQEVAEDGPTKRWPRWIRTPFIWGWDSDRQCNAASALILQRCDARRVRAWLPALPAFRCSMPPSAVKLTKYQ
jgi:hypothetical protein